MATPSAVRHLFQMKLKHGIPIPPGEFHPQDLERVNDDIYLLRILKQVENDLKQATDTLWDIMVWRKTMRAYDINERTINMDYVKHATIFPHGRDVEGGLLLIVKAKTHHRGQRNIDEVKKIIIYWFDRIEREENGKQMSLFFDMEACGLSNMDMELIKFLISLKNYYPDLVNYIIIYELPWVLTASFKIIKSLLPEKVVAKMKFLTKATLKEYVAPEQALACWGGKSNYVFEFVPEKRKLEHTPKSYENGTVTEHNLTKKVTFIEQEANQHSPGEMLMLNPNDVIVFHYVDDDITGKITLTNMDDCAVAFKIKTTSPEKFIARPCSGVLPVGASQTVVIVIQPGFPSHAQTRDRFLVMSVQLPRPNLSQQELSEIWRSSSASKIDEYRLKCHFPDKETSVSGSDIVETNRIEDKLDSIANALNTLQNDYQKLKQQSRWITFYQFVILIMTSAWFVLGYLAVKKLDLSYRPGGCINLHGLMVPF